MFWKNKKLKTFVNEFSTITCEHVEINKVGKNKLKTYATNGNEMARTQIIKILSEHKKTMQSQATKGISFFKKKKQLIN